MAQPLSRGISAGQDADPAVLLLGALGWICGDARRAERLLALTGLDADTLRAEAGTPAVLAAVAAFLADHEPDLIACAAALDIAPAALVAAGPRLRRDR